MWYVEKLALTTGTSVEGFLLTPERGQGRAKEPGR